MHVLQCVISHNMFHLLFTISGVTGTTGNPEMDAINEKFVSCFNSGDFEGVAALYHADCRLMPQGMPMVIGRERKSVFLHVSARGGIMACT